MIGWRRQRLLLGKHFPPFLNSRKEKFGNLMKKFRQFFPKRILLFQTKILLENYFFSWKLCFLFSFFSTLSYLFSVSVLKLCCRNLKKLISKPNKKFCGENFFFKLCSFVILADIEVPSDFRRSFSTGLPKLYSECSVERYQQRDTFWEISYFLHVFGLSVKKNEDRWRKSFARASNEKSMFLDDCSRKKTLVVRKTFSSIFELSEKKVRELDEKIPAVFSKEILLFQPKILLEKYFFLKIMFSFHFFSTLSYLFSVSVLKLCCRDLKRLIWKPNKKVCGENFFLKLCRFVIFADTEFPSDFRRSFSTVLSKVYPECSVESYQ